MFVFGGLPALMMAFIRYGVHESKSGKKFGEAEQASVRRCRRRSALCSRQIQARHLRHVGSVPRVDRPAVGRIHLRAGGGNAAGDAGWKRRLMRLGSLPMPGYVLAVGTIIGCVLVPFVAESVGRRLSMAIFLTITGLSAAVGFGYVFYLPGNPLTLFFVCVFFMGLGGANFANYTIWLPELYTTDCRASAIGFISSVGRFVGVAMTFVLAGASGRMAASACPWPSSLWHSSSASRCYRLRRRQRARLPA